MRPATAAGGLFHGDFVACPSWTAGTIAWPLTRVHSGFHLSAPTPYAAPAWFWKPVSAFVLLLVITSVSAVLTSASSAAIGNVVARLVSVARRSTIAP